MEKHHTLSYHVVIPANSSAVVCCGKLVVVGTTLRSNVCGSLLKWQHVQGDVDRGSSTESSVRTYVREWMRNASDANRLPNSSE